VRRAAQITQVCALRSFTSRRRDGRALILERQREGIAAARQRGAYTGRKPALTLERAPELCERAAAGERKSVLAKEFAISRETVYRYLRTATTADITG
jgi:DNA invertase Pin-like site-specific DNA recombinase